MKIVTEEEQASATRTMRQKTVQQRLVEQGVDLNKLSQQDFDLVLRLFDEGDKINGDTNKRIQEVQRNAEAEIQRLSQESNQKMTPLTQQFLEFIKIHQEPPQKVEVPGEKHE